MKMRIAGLLVSVLILGLLLGDVGCSLEGTPASPPAQERGSGQQESEEVGELVVSGKLVPARSATLAFTVTGIVSEILVSEGDRIDAGQVLVRLVSERQRAAVAQAEAGLRRAQANLDALRAGPRPQEVEEARAVLAAAEARLTKVKQGPRPEEVAAAEAALTAAQAYLEKLQKGPDENDLAAARAELSNAEAALRQAQSAYDQVSWRSDIEMLPQSLRLQEATNNYNVAKARLEKLLSEPSEATMANARAQVQKAEAELNRLKSPVEPADIAAAEAEVLRAQAQLELLLAGARPEALATAEAEVAAAKASLEQARAALAETELRAPFAGVVASVDVRVGEQVTPGAAVIRLADFSSWQVETTDLTELDVVRIEVGSPVTVTFDAIPGLELTGRVVQIKQIGETRQGDVVYTAIVKLDGQDKRLRWNMTASVTARP